MPWTHGPFLADLGRDIEMCRAIDVSHGMEKHGETWRNTKLVSEW
jgi:hypothetical protein